MMRRAVALALLGLSLAWGAGAQSGGTGHGALAMAHVALGTDPGSASVAHWRDGQMAHAVIRRLPGSDANPVETMAVEGAPPLFEVGSVSKVFTGLLLAQAVERGELSLDDTLGRLLRGKLAFVSPQVAAITLRQLITHSACLPRQFGGVANGRAVVAQLRKADRVDLMAALEKQTIAQAAPCTSAYSNYGLAVVGELLSEHYGKSWTELVHERIVVPLGLRDTRQHLGDQADRLVAGFAGRAPAAPWLMDAYSGAGGLRSSAQDLVRFGRAILAGRNGPLGPAAERLLTPLGRYQGHEIGYAIFIHGPPQRRTYSHSGLTGGYRALLALSPDNGEVLAALVSNAQAPLSQMAQPWWAARYPVSDKTVAVDAASLAPLAGVYQAGAELSLTVALHEERIFVRSRGGIFRAYLPVARDTFTRPAGGARIVFERDARGLVTGLSLEQAGAQLAAQRTRDPLPAGQILPPGKAQQFVGRYAVANAPGDGIAFDVRSEDGQLMIRSTAFGWEPVLPLAERADRFRYDAPDAQLQFERDADGRVVALVLHQRGELRAMRLAPGS